MVVLRTENSMEDKQINYHQPLPSLRRFPSRAPAEKSKHKKHEHSMTEIYPLPSSEPGYKSGHIRNAGTVPFIWEQYPGRAKDESKAKKTNQSPVDNFPRLSHRRIMEKRQQSYRNLSGGKQSKKVSYGLHKMSVSKENETKVESTQDVIGSEDSDTWKQHEEYCDAPNTISRTGPFFLNGSLSGTSDLDGSSVNTYRNFSIDPQTKEFKMDRFLPAAKAMTYSARQYAPRKQSVVPEQTRPISKVVNGGKSSLWYGANVENEEEESDDDYDHDVLGQLPAKACGLIPKFCIKSSFILLNQLPGMHGKMRGQLSTGGRTHDNSLCAGSCCKNVNEKLKGSTLYKRVQRSAMPSPRNELSYAKKPLSSHDYELNRCTFPEHRGAFRKPLSSHDYELPRYVFSEHRGAFRNPGEVKNAEKTGVNNNGKGPPTGTKSNEEVDTRGPMMEKTLNVDIVKKVAIPYAYSYDLNIKGRSNLNTDVSKDVEKCKTMENTQPADSSYKDVKCFYVKDMEENMKILAQGHVDDFSAPSLPDRSNLGGNFIEDSAVTAKFKVFNNGFEGHQSLKAEDEEKSKGSYFNFLLPPPSLKSPSDSWLSRTLLSMGSRTTSLRAHISNGIYPGNHAFNTFSVDHKWETIVKSTRDHR